MDELLGVNALTVKVQSSSFGSRVKLILWQRQDTGQQQKQWSLCPNSTQEGGNLSYLWSIFAKNSSETRSGKRTSVNQPEFTWSRRLKCVHPTWVTFKVKSGNLSSVLKAGKVGYPWLKIITQWREEWELWWQERLTWPFVLRWMLYSNFFASKI